VQVIIHDRKPAHRNRKAVGQPFQPIFDPLLSMLVSLAAQEGSANTSGNAMIVTGYVYIHQLGSGHSHIEILPPQAE
jgi:hypothetical protein